MIGFITYFLFINFFFIMSMIMEEFLLTMFHNRALIKGRLCCLINLLRYLQAGAGAGAGATYDLLFFREIKRSRLRLNLLISLKKSKSL